MNSHMFRNSEKNKLLRFFSSSFFSRSEDRVLEYLFFFLNSLWTWIAHGFSFWLIFRRSHFFMFSNKFWTTLNDKSVVSFVQLTKCAFLMLLKMEFIAHFMHRKLCENIVSLKSVDIYGNLFLSFLCSFQPFSQRSHLHNEFDLFFNCCCLVAAAATSKWEWNEVENIWLVLLEILCRAMK